MVYVNYEQNSENKKNEHNQTKNQTKHQEGLRPNQNQIRNDCWSIGEIEEEEEKKGDKL